MSNLPAPTVDPAPERFCPDCGYNLRGIASDRCPECGMALGGISSSTVPWAHRVRIGRVRAFVRTVWLATFHPDRLARAVVAPLDRRDAERFRWVVTAVAATPLILLFGAAVWHKGGTGFLNLLDLDPTVPIAVDRFWEWRAMWSAGATLLPIVTIGILLMLFLWTGCARYWFSVEGLTPTQRERAIIVSRYTSAPLAWIVVFVVLLGAAWGLEAAGLFFISRVGYFLLICLAGLALALGVFGTWWSTLRVLSRATHCSSARWFAAAAGVPISWVLGAGIAFGIFPCVIGLAWIAVDSLR